MDDETIIKHLERFESHLERFEQHEINEEQNFNKLVKTQLMNTDAISSIATSVQELVDDTKSIVQLHKDFQGAARLGNGLQKFLIWVLKWGAIGTGVATTIVWVTEHFNK